MSRFFRLSFLVIASLCLVSACDQMDTSKPYPQDHRDVRKDSRGKLTGEGLLVMGGPEDEEGAGGSSPIGVNSFLWRATLDTLAFMPLASADPFGGVIITDWYEDPSAQGERFKVNALILDRSLRADGIKISVFKQRMDDKGTWRDIDAAASVARDLEDTILTRARQLKVGSLK